MPSSDGTDSDESASASNEIIRTLGKEVRRLKASLRSSEVRAHALQASHEDLQAKYDDVVADGHALEVDYRGLQIKYDDLVATGSGPSRTAHDTLLETHADLEAKAAALGEENARLRGQLDSIRSVIKDEEDEPCIPTAGNVKSLQARMAELVTERQPQIEIEENLKAEEAEAVSIPVWSLRDRIAHTTKPARHTPPLEVEGSRSDDASSESGSSGSASDSDEETGSSDSDSNDGVSSSPCPHM